MILKVSCRICRIKILDEPRQLRGVMRLCYIHGVICTNIVLLMDMLATVALTRGILVHLIILPTIGIKAGQLSPLICNAIVQILLHNRCIGALGQLPSFLDSALTEDVLAHGEFAR